MSESFTIPPQMNSTRFNQFIAHALTKEATRIVKVNNSGSYEMLSGENGAILGTSSTGISLVQTAISSIGTGNVYVKSGGYGTGSISLPDQTVLILDEGAMTFTYTPASGATCTILDYEAGKITYYEEGVLSAEINMNSGTIYLRESLTAPTITGSTYVSGSNFLGPNATITNVNVTNLSSFTGVNATFIDLTGSNISGSYIIASHGLTKDCSYIIYSGSNLYWAENGFNGKIDFSGSDAATVINASINATTSTGGRIFVSPALYPIYSPVVMKPNIEIFGVYGTIGTLDGTILKQMDHINVIEYIVGSPGAEGNFSIHDFIINGNNRTYTGSAIYIKNAALPTIKNVRIDNFYGSGVYFENVFGAFSEAISHVCANNCGDPVNLLPTFFFGGASGCANLHITNIGGSLCNYVGLSVLAAEMKFNHVFFDSVVPVQPHIRLEIGSHGICMDDVDVRVGPAGTNAIDVYARESKWSNLHVEWVQGTAFSLSGANCTALVDNATFEGESTGSPINNGFLCQGANSNLIVSNYAYKYVTSIGSATYGNYVCTNSAEMNTDILFNGSNKPYTYTIYSGSGYYWAENGSDGNIDFGGSINAGGVSGGDGSTLFTTVINTMGTGSIFVKKGTYKADIVLPRNITLTGENRRNTIILGTLSFDQTNYPLDLYPTRIEHLFIDGKTVGKDYGVDIRGDTQAVTFLDVRANGTIADFNLSGSDMYRMVFDHCTTAYGGNYGFYLSGFIDASYFVDTDCGTNQLNGFMVSDTGWLIGTLFERCKFIDASGSALTALGYLTKNTFNTCLFTDLGNTGIYPIYLSYSGSAFPNLICRNNVFVNTELAFNNAYNTGLFYINNHYRDTIIRDCTGYGTFFIDTGSEYTSFTNISPVEDRNSVTGYPYFIDSGSGTTYHGFIWDYPVEISGQATGDASSGVLTITFPNRILTTPDYVHVTPVGTSATFLYINTIDYTNITVGARLFSGSTFINPYGNITVNYTAHCKGLAPP
jgi:hypothetical protein